MNPFQLKINIRSKTLIFLRFFIRVRSFALSLPWWVCHPLVSFTYFLFFELIFFVFHFRCFLSLFFLFCFSFFFFFTLNFDFVCRIIWMVLVLNFFYELAVGSIDVRFPNENCHVASTGWDQVMIVCTKANFCNMTWVATIFVEFCFRSYARVFEKFNHAIIISSRNDNRISGSIYGVDVRVVYTCPNALHVESQLLGVGQPLSAYERTGSIVENNFVSCYVKK